MNTNRAGRKIRERRKVELGWSLEVLAERLGDIGIDVSTLSRIETGQWEAHPPTEFVIERIAAELELDTDYLKLDFEEDRRDKAKSKLAASETVAILVDDATQLLSKWKDLIIEKLGNIDVEEDADDEIELYSRTLEALYKSAPTDAARNAFDKLRPGKFLFALLGSFKRQQNLRMRKLAELSFEEDSRSKDATREG